jgi:hypothetical protein
MEGGTMTHLHHHNIACFCCCRLLWKSINCYCGDDNDKKVRGVTVLESISQCEGEEEPQIIHHSQERCDAALTRRF